MIGAALLDARAVWIPKSGNAEHEWEDAAGISTRNGRVAVADGASSAFDAGRWARHVVTAWLAGPPEPGGFDAWHRATAATFAPAHVDDTGDWFDMEAAARPSYCTLLGVRRNATAGPRPTWSVIAVGDTNLFHLRDRQLVASWPIDDHTDFDSSPALLSSDPGDLATPQHRTIEAQPGDMFVLATDAIAEWALGHPDQEAALHLLAEIDQDGLRRLVGDLRSCDAIVNDDVTVVRCTGV